MSTHPASTTESDLPLRLLRSLLHCNSRLRAARGGARLPSSALQVMGIIYRCGPSTMTRLAGELGIKKQSLTVLLNTLHGTGFILRGPDPYDARKVLLKLTEKGKEALLADLGQRRLVLEQRMEALLSAEDLHALAAALPALEKLALGEERAS